MLAPNSPLRPALLALAVLPVITPNSPLLSVGFRGFV